MSGPWEQYQTPTQEVGPWSQYGGQARPDIETLKATHAANVAAGEEIDPTTLGSALSKAGAGVLEGVASIPGSIYGMAKQGIDPALAIGRSVGRVTSGQSTVGQEVGKVPGYIQRYGAEVAQGLASPLTEALPKFIYGTPREAGQIAGQYAGMALAPEVARGVVKGAQTGIGFASGRLIDSLIKTQPKEFRYGNTPGLEVAKQKLIAPNKTALLRMINERGNEIHQNVQAQLNDPTHASKIVDINPAVKVVDEAIGEAVNRGEQPLYNRLQTLKDQLTRGFSVEEGKITPTGEPRTQLSPAQANDLKVQIGKGSTWTGQAFDNEVNKVRRQVYGALNDVVDQSVPGTKAQNAQVSNLIGARNSLQRLLTHEESRNMMGPIAAKGMSGAIGAMLGSHYGLPWEGGAAAGMAAQQILGSTPVKTGVAAGLATMVPRDMMKSFSPGYLGGRAPKPPTEAPPEPVRVNPPGGRPEGPATGEVMPQRQLKAAPPFVERTVGPPPRFGSERGSFSNKPVGPPSDPYAGAAGPAEPDMTLGGYASLNNISPEAQQFAGINRPVGPVETKPAPIGGLEAKELPQREGFMPVYRGAGPRGMKELRPSEEGSHGPGVYFYDNPIDARAYAGREGGIVSGYVKPEDVQVHGTPRHLDENLMMSGGRVVVLKDPSKFVRHEEPAPIGNLPNEPIVEKAPQADWPGIGEGYHIKWPEMEAGSTYQVSDKPGQTLQDKIDFFKQNFPRQ